MKIAMVGTYPLDPEIIRGGVQSVIYNLVEGLRRHSDLDIHVVAHSSDVKENLTRPAGNVTLHFYPTVTRFNNITFGLMEHRHIKRLFDELKPDLIHFQDHAISLLPPPYPWLLTVHGITFEEVKFLRGFKNRARGFFRSQLEKMVLRPARQIIALSPYAARAIGHLTSAQMHFIDNPVDGKYFQLADRAEPGRILLVGFICHRKNILALAQAVNLVKRVHPEIKAYIAGAVSEPDYFRDVERYLAAHDLQGQVVFLGHLDEARLREEYEKCSLLALTSLGENSPIAIQQAMAAGKPVVATDVGGVAHLVADGKTGFLVKTGDIAGLADRIQRLLADEALRKAYGQAGRAEALQRFTREAVADKTYALYQELISQGRKEGRP
jgi:glycosyltransferase involved in cell wall biosynthesis